MATKAELVFIPAPGMGHLVSMVELAKLLAVLNSNLTITVILVKPPHDKELSAYVDSLTADKASPAGIKFIDLPQPETNKLDAHPITLMSILVQALIPFVKDVVTNSSSGPDSPRLAGFVLDLLFTDFVPLANEFNVPAYVFGTSSAAFLGFNFYIQTLLDEQNVNLAEFKDSDKEFAIPSFLNPVPSKFLPTATFDPEIMSVVTNLVRGLKQTKGVMINTFRELESHALDSLPGSAQVPSMSFYPVGPILNLQSATQLDSNIMKWLDEQSPSSVVFLCFGSTGTFNVEQVKEIACALEKCGHRFLWVLRKPSDLVKGQTLSTVKPTDYDDMSEALPEGFLARTVDSGKVIGWAPQRAIGGFVSHCGWNSILESIWFGVPIATWPLYAEQQLNAFEFVTGLGLAVEIKMDYRNELIGPDEVEIVLAERIEKGIRCVMEQDSDVRKKVKDVSEKSRSALMDGGFSHSALHSFINDVMANIS